MENKDMQEINLLPFMVEAFGFNKKIHRDVDKLYKKHKYMFYSEAKKSEFYNHQIVTEGNLIQEEYCKKALGILLCANETKEINTSVHKIIQKGWPYPYTYVQNHSKIDISDFIVRIIKKAGGVDNISDDEVNTNITIMVFLSFFNQKEIIYNDGYNMFLGNVIVFRMELYKDDCKHRVNYNAIHEETLKEIKQLKNRIFNDYGKLDSFDNAERCKKRLNKLLPSLDFIFDFEKLAAVSVMNMKLSDREIEELLYIYILVYKDDNDTNKATEFLIISIYIRSLLKAYKNAKEYYFKNNKETLFIELEGLEKSYEKIKSSNNIKDEKIKDLLEQIEQKDKEIARLKVELEEAKTNTLELNSMRECLFDLYTETDYKIEHYDFSKLKDIKGVILGGHPNWQNKMKETLQSFAFISADNLNFDTSILKNADFIFIYTDHLSHAIYYRAMAEIKRSNIKIKHLSVNTNMDIVLQHIYETCIGTD